MKRLAFSILLVVGLSGCAPLQHGAAGLLNATRSIVREELAGHESVPPGFATLVADALMPDLADRLAPPEDPESRDIWYMLGTVLGMGGFATWHNRRDRRTFHGPSSRP